MNLTVFRLLVAYGFDSGAIMATLVFYDHSDIMTKMVWSQGSHIKRRLLYFKFSALRIYDKKNTTIKFLLLLDSTKVN